MLKEFEDIINEMDSELSEYSQKITYEQKLSNLKEKYKNETNLINEITYEIDSLNFFIEQGKLIPLFGYGNHCYPDINKFDDGYKNYLKQRFQDTSNSILKNMYLIIILNLKLKQEMNFFIDQSLNLLNYYLATEIEIELGNDLLMTTFDKCMSYRYKKDDIKLLIVKYVKAEFNTIFNRKHLIELMLLKKKVFKNDDFEGIEDICWECAQKSASRTKIEFLLLGQKISQKLQNNADIWFDEIGKTYENLAEERQDSMVQIIHLSDAIEYYKKGKNPQKVEETSIKLKNIQKKFEPASIPFKFNVDSEINIILTEIYEKIPLDSNSFLEFLIHDKNEFLIPKLEKDDKNYNNFMDTAPLLSMINQLKLDNNHNIIQTLKIDNEEERIMDSNYRQYHLSLIFQKIFLNEIFVYASNLKIFTYDSVITYLSNCQKFLNISNNEKPLLYYFKPVIKEYFKQFELYLSNEEYNFVLFIDSLVSKLEFLVRKLCEIYNISMLKPQGNGTTSEKLLHDFFNDSNFKEVLLENDYDFLKFILLKPGLNLRNKSAHGFDLEIYTVNNANLLLLCFFRLLKYFI
ncbi:DUF4209 domain-containing protein [uncultured Methanobrevibacter sp.]|uniref:DUF4209 domain-containing protein n=1 Tax=uncultured Methanobrevibacter sp. TaxID=253161 RepID=UPI0025870243|nr:DUF4209 domain-containing protein [uncultured Methanobrevibacter sp.]